MEHSILIMGSMYSGKSEELKRLIKRSEIAGKKCQMFKLAIDNRYSNDQILTHDGAKILNIIDNIEIKNIISNLLGTDAISIANSKEILELVHKDTQVVGIDEIQFFDEGIIDIVETLNKKNIRVIMSGLDMYANGDIFPITSILACKCKYVQKLHAVCIECGGEAMYSHKIEDDLGNNLATVDIGSEGKYIALCEKCRQSNKK